MRTKNREAVRKEFQAAFYKARDEVLSRLASLRALMVRRAAGETTVYGRQYPTAGERISKAIEVERGLVQHSLAWMRRERRLYWEACK